MHAAKRYLAAERRWLDLAVKAAEFEVERPGVNVELLHQQRRQLAVEVAEMAEALAILDAVLNSLTVETACERVTELLTARGRGGDDQESRG